MFRIEFISSLSSPIFISNHDSISNHDTLKFNLIIHKFNSIDKITSKIRNIHSTIWLPCDPKIIRQKLRESSVKCLNCTNTITGGSALVVNIARIFVYWESYSWWSFKEEKVCFLVPWVRIEITRELIGARVHDIGS